MTDASEPSNPALPTVAIPVVVRPPKLIVPEALKLRTLLISPLVPPSVKVKILFVPSEMLKVLASPMDKVYPPLTVAPESV